MKVAQLVQLQVQGCSLLPVVTSIQSISEALKTSRSFSFETNDTLRYPNLTMHFP